jgi:hypothetical protein
MNKIKKFKKSKKTNNKRNHKRRHITRKLRGGGLNDKPEWPLGTPQPLKVESKPPPPNDEAIYIPSRIEPSQEIQRLDRINEIPQRKELVTREDYDILRDKIDTLKQNVDELLKIKDNEIMVPLYLANQGQQVMRFVNKNITELNQADFPLLYEPSYYPAIDLYQLLKFRQLKKIDFNIFTHSSIILPELNDDNGMPNIIGPIANIVGPGIIGPGTSLSGEDLRYRNRKIISLFEDLEKVSYSKIKYIYLSPNSILRMGPIEYDLEGLKDILILDGLLDRE